MGGKEGEDLDDTPPPTSCQNYMPKKDITYPSGIRLLLNHPLVAHTVKYLPTMQETQV